MPRRMDTEQSLCRDKQTYPEDKQFHPHSEYFISLKTTTVKKKFSSYEWEVLVMIRELEKFRPYP